MHSTPPLDSLLKSRSTLIELIVAAIGLALGVNLLASAIAAHFEPSGTTILAIGAVLTLVSLIAIGRRTLATRSVARNLEGFLCFRHDPPNLISIPRYRYSEEIEQSLSALFAENEAPKKLWGSDPVHKKEPPDQALDIRLAGQTAAGKLIVEATEYFVLETLSTHLTDYFNQPALDSTKVRELTREDLGPLVFGNRFLDTFSRPMKERAAFVDQTMEDDPNNQHIVAAYGNGVMFSRFDLVLPEKATVTRLDKGLVSIDAPKFRMTLRVDFQGYGSVLPTDFYELYLGESSMDVRAYKVEASVTIEFKRFALLTRSGWEYHRWLDSFLDKLEEDISHETFLERIGWEAAITTARVVERSVAALEQKKAQPQAASGDT
ncbi:MAG: hypothetical protein Q8O81_04600 [Giesbergeria sp.]|nr:hypothetical protein [Giesbergeria sp.]